MPLRAATLLRDNSKIMSVKQGTLAHKDNAHYMLPRNDRQFSKRVYTLEDGHTGQSKQYMRASIDLSFDGGNYFNVKKDLKKDDLKDILITSQRQGSFAAPKDLLKI